MQNKTSYKFIIDNVQSRQEQWQGEAYMVVPVIAMVEGVHQGSGGPVFYPGNELAKFPEAWNGRPLPVFHPTELDGTPVSCNDPDIIEAQSVGQTFNFRYEEGKLKGEAWINIEKAKEISPAILSIIQSHDRLEVSTGLFGDTDATPGTWNEETYDSILRNFRPDHLALLPGGKGACSWEDGCGVRVNKKGGVMKFENFAKAKQSLDVDFWKLLLNEDSHEEVRRAIQGKIDALDNNNWVHFVRAVYDDYFVYRAEPISPSNNGQPQLWKQSYDFADNEVDFKDNPIEVREKTSFTTINALDKELNIMSKKKTDDKGCCPEKVQLLIENEATPWTEEQREMLEGLTQEQINAMMPAEKSAIQKVVDATAQDITDGKLTQQAFTLTANGMEKVEPKKEDTKPDDPPTVESYLANAPAEISEALQLGLKVTADKKAAMIESILANAANIVPKEKLEKMDVDTLEPLARLAVQGSKTTDFSVNAGSHHKDTKVEVLEAPKFSDYVPAAAAK